MKSELTLADGSVFVVDRDPEDLVKSLYNHAGVLVNKFILVGETYIQTSQIVTIGKVEK